MSLLPGERFISYRRRDEKAEWDARRRLRERVCRMLENAVAARDRARAIRARRSEKMGRRRRRRRSVKKGFLRPRACSSYQPLVSSETRYQGLDTSERPGDERASVNKDVHFLPRPSPSTANVYAFLCFLRMYSSATPPTADANAVTPTACPRSHQPRARSSPERTLATHQTRSSFRIQTFPNSSRRS